MLRGDNSLRIWRHLTASRFSTRCGCHSSILEAPDPVSIFHILSDRSFLLQFRLWFCCCPATTVLEAFVKSTTSHVTTQLELAPVSYGPWPNDGALHGSSFQGESFEMRSPFDILWLIVSEHADQDLVHALYATCRYTCHVNYPSVPSQIDAAATVVERL